MQSFLHKCFCGGGQQRWQMIQDQDPIYPYMTLQVIDILWHLFYELETWESKMLSDFTKAQARKYASLDKINPFFLEVGVEGRRVNFSTHISHKLFLCFEFLWALELKYLKTSFPCHFLSAHFPLPGDTQLSNLAKGVSHFQQKAVTRLSRNKMAAQSPFPQTKSSFSHITE